MSSFFGGGGGSDRRRAKRNARNTPFTGGSLFGPGGIGAGFSFENNQANVTSELGDLGPLFQQLMETADFGLNQAQGGLPPELSQLFGDSIDSLGTISNQNSGDFAGLGSIFNNSLDIANADPFALGGGVADKLRQLSERKNQRDVANTFDRLKASGKLGTSGGAGIAAELEQNIFDQGLQFDLAGLDAGRQLQTDAFGRVINSSNAREGIAGRGFQEAFQSILAQTGIGQQGFQDLLQQQQQGANIGFGAGQNAMAVQQSPLAFLQALLAAGTTGSNSQFNAGNLNLGIGAQELEESNFGFDFLGSLTGGLLQPGGVLNKD